VIVKNFGLLGCDGAQSGGICCCNLQGTLMYLQTFCTNVSKCTHHIPEDHNPSPSLHCPAVLSVQMETF
jgi:hypothetical protein